MNQINHWPFLLRIKAGWLQNPHLHLDLALDIDGHTLGSCALQFAQHGFVVLRLRFDFIKSFSRREVQFGRFVHRRSGQDQLVPLSRNPRDLSDAIVRHSKFNQRWLGGWRNAEERTRCKLIGAEDQVCITDPNKIVHRPV